MRWRSLVLILLLMSVTLQAQPAADGSEALSAFLKGDYQGAETLLEGPAGASPVGLRVSIELSLRSGEFEQAAGYARTLLSAYRNNQLSTPLAQAQAGFAAWQLQRWEEANDIFIDVAEAGQAPSSMYVDWGNLYLEKYNPSEAERIFREGLEAEQEPEGLRRWSQADLYLGLSRAFRDQSISGASQALEKAEGLEPDSRELLAERALLAIRDEDYDDARGRISTGLGHDPGFLPLLELDYVLHYFEGKLEDAAAAKVRLEAVNPRDANLYELLGDLSVIRRRLEEAVEYYDQAFQFNPNQWSALASKGINQLRLGREVEGIESLELAYKNDPYNLWTVNTLRLVDSFERFEKFETEHFSIKLHREQAEALRPYVEELLERCLKTLEEKYGHEIEGKIVFEMYPDHEDFAVRTLGMPGLGALGATFGRVVAMDSPSARPRGEFHWASTLWHEIAHVVTLALSNGNVPRWFTEGLSMMEERRGGTGWGDGLSVGFVKAYEQGELLPISKLNSGFLRPETPNQLAISYFQAGWICEFLEQRYGAEKIRRMLVAYGEGLETDEVFETVLGESVEQVDSLFQEELKAKLQPLVGVLEMPEALPDIDELLVAVEASPENYFLNIAAGESLIELERSAEAIPYLRKAIELFPDRADGASPYASLAKALAEERRSEELVEVLEEWWTRSPLAIDTAFRLADLLEGSSDDTALTHLESALYLDPLSQVLHRRLGDSYARRGSHDLAIREYGVLLSLKPIDAAGAHFRLAQQLSLSGRREEARREILFALEIAPGYEEAQRLLLELVRQ